MSTYRVTTYMGHHEEVEAEWCSVEAGLLFFYEKNEGFTPGKLVASFSKWESVVQQ